MTWRIVWYIAGRWYEARAERLAQRVLADRVRQRDRHAALTARAEKFFRRAGL